MHATTLGQLSQTLGSYIAPGQSFAPVLNQALEVVYNMGVWRDLTIEGSFDCSTGYFSLPDQADTVLFAVIDGQPRRVRSLWHDYNVLGTIDDQLVHLGLIDDGYRPTLVDIAADTAALYVDPASDAPGSAAYTPANGELITVRSNDGTKAYSNDFTSGSLSFAPAIDYVNEIRYESLQNRYDIRTTDNDPTTTIATVGPGTGIARFRRYRVPNAQAGSFAHILCKRRFVPLINDSDPVYISNINALKHALLAVLAEDNADLERAEVHWGKCKAMLDDQLDQYRGPARPALDLQFFGDSVKGIVSHY